MRSNCYICLGTYQRDMITIFANVCLTIIKFKRCAIIIVNASILFIIADIYTFTFYNTSEPMVSRMVAFDNVELACLRSNECILLCPCPHHSEEHSE